MVHQQEFSSQPVSNEFHEIRQGGCDAANIVGNKRNRDYDIRYPITNTVKTTTENRDQSFVKDFFRVRASFYLTGFDWETGLSP